MNVLISDACFLCIEYLKWLLSSLEELHEVEIRIITTCKIKDILWKMTKSMFHVKHLVDLRLD